MISSFCEYYIDISILHPVMAMTNFVVTFFPIFIIPKVLQRYLQVRDYLTNFYTENKMFKYLSVKCSEDDSEIYKKAMAVFEVKFVNDLLVVGCHTQ